jgi:hypothetical protein
MRFFDVGRRLAGAFRKREQARGLRAGLPGVGISRGLFACTLLWGLVATVRAEPAPAPAADEGWNDLAGYLFRDAHDAFARSSAGADRRRALGVAASELSEPPVSPGKVADVEAQLRRLIADQPADEPAIYARYLLARIAHLHRPAEIAEIEAAYRAVIAAAPAHPLAQLAAGKLALVLLYQRPDLAVSERISAAAALAPVAGAAQLPETACVYYRVLAEAAMYYDVLDERVLGWLQRAEAIGPREIMTATSLRIQLAEVARALGHRDEALAYYRRYLATAASTDNRYHTVAERLADLAKATK